MEILGDDAAAVRALGGRRPVRVELDELPADLARLWRHLAVPCATPWRAALSPAGGAASAIPADPRGATHGHGPGPLLVAREVGFSQFERMTALVRAGDVLPDRLACAALAGSRFRGQRGRPWTALAGNLHLVAHLELDVDAATTQAGLTLLPSVATARAIERVSEDRVRPGAKWVNDLLVDGRKVGGVLSATQLQDGRVRHLVVGIGVNVARAPSLPASSRALPAGALAEADPAFAAEGAWARLLRSVMTELVRARAQLRAGGSPALLGPYRERAVFLGRRVTIWPVEEGAAAPLVRGRVRALNADLSLQLDGVAAPVRRGRMTFDA
jgi:BirA family biotin operon repressor/biotin-[acetyl-CoA-carboxylase] ligase